MIELSIGDVIAIVVSLAALVFSIIVYMRKNPQATPAAVDAKAADDLHSYQRERENFERLERAYATSSEERKVFVQATATILRVFASVLPGVKTLDAAADVIEDIIQPGNQSDPPPIVPGEEIPPADSAAA